MSAHLEALRSSADHLRDLVTPLTDDQLDDSAYPTDWTVADVLSHIGSGAVIQQRRLDDGLADQPTSDDFAPGVWDAWDAKPPRAKADDGLAADGAFVDRLESVTDDERARFRFAMGPMSFDFGGLVGLRLNEHALHSWDIEVALDPAAVVAAEAASLLVDNLELIARYTAKPTGNARTITVHTTDPARQFTVDLAPDVVTFTPGASDRDPDVTLAAEAFARLAYGRLDPEHTPAFAGDPNVLQDLRRVFPGP